MDSDTTGRSWREGSLADLVQDVIKHARTDQIRGGENVRSQIRSAFAQLARALAPESAPERLSAEQAAEILSHIDARSFLYGDADQSRISTLIYSVMVPNECDDTTRTRRMKSARQYSYAVRSAFDAADALDWPVYAAPIQPAIAEAPTVFLTRTNPRRLRAERAAKGLVGPQTVLGRLHAQRYGYYPWSPEELDLRARLERLENEVTEKAALLDRLRQDLTVDVRSVVAAQTELAALVDERDWLRPQVERLRAVRWSDELQPCWDEYAQFLRSKAYKGNRRRRSATVDFQRRTFGQFAGFLTYTDAGAVTPLVPTPLIPKERLDRDAFVSALIDKDDRYLRHLPGWYAQRYASASESARVSQDGLRGPLPHQLQHVLEVIGFAARRYFIPVSEGRKPSSPVPADSVRALELLKDVLLCEEDETIQGKEDRLADGLPTTIEMLHAVDLLDRAIWSGLEEEGQPKVVLRCITAEDLASAQRDSVIMRGMLAIPQRRRNWIEAELGTTITRLSTGAYRFVFPRRKVKNYKDVIATFAPDDPDLPEHAVLCDRLDRFFGYGKYAEEYRAMGKQAPRDVLMNCKPQRRRRPPNPRIAFPSVGGCQMDPTTMWQNLVKWSELTLGRRVNPHLYRDIVATTILSHDPREITIVAWLLGDTEEMVKRHYSHLTLQNALERSARLLTEIRGGRASRHWLEATTTDESDEKQFTVTEVLSLLGKLGLSAVQLAKAKHLVA